MEPHSDTQTLRHTHTHTHTHPHTHTYIMKHHPPLFGTGQGCFFQCLWREIGSIRERQKEKARKGERGRGKATGEVIYLFNNGTSRPARRAVITVTPALPRRHKWGEGGERDRERVGNRMQEKDRDGMKTRKRSRKEGGGGGVYFQPSRLIHHSHIK